MRLASVLIGIVSGSGHDGFLKQLFLGLRDPLEGREMPDKGPGLSNKDGSQLVPVA